MVAAEVWRQQGAPDSDILVPESFLRSLVESSSGRVAEQVSQTEQTLFSICVDDGGFDCRIGDRARKKKREAHKVAESRHKSADPKGGPANSSGPTSDKRKKAKSIDKPGTAGKQLGPSKLSKATTVTKSGRVSKSSRTNQTLTPRKTPSPANLPPGWQMHVRFRQGGRQHDKVYTAPGGERFSSFTKVQEHCLRLGIAMPPGDESGNEQQEEEEVEDFSLLDLRHWIAKCAARGCLPKGHRMHLAYLRARDKLLSKGKVSVWQDLLSDEDF